MSEKVPDSEQEEIRDINLKNLVDMKQSLKANPAKVNKEWSAMGYQSSCSSRALNHAIYNAAIKGKYTMTINQGIVVLKAIQSYGFKALKTTSNVNVALSHLQFLYRSVADNIIAKSDKTNGTISKASHSLDTSMGYEFGINDKNIGDNNLYLVPKGQTPQLVAIKDIKNELSNLIVTLEKINKNRKE